MKRQLYIFLIPLFLTIFLTSCTGTGVPINSFDKSLAERKVGKVYVLRDSHMAGKITLMTIYLNDNLIGEIGEGEVAEGQVQDGKNLLSISNAFNVPAQFSFIGNTSKNYYFKTRYLSLTEAISSSSISNINIKIDRVDSDFQIYDN